jgi:archaemetzincin
MIDLMTAADFPAKRKQYHSTAILKEFLHSFPPDALKATGIVPFDLFIPILTFVFGEAQLNGRVAVVSTARLDRRSMDYPPTSGFLTGGFLKKSNMS